jgi:parvulin-like peptidyl-prolyl isomerase
MLMEKVRSVTKYFMWVVAASFIIFMFFGFGSNILGGRQRKEDLIAKVNNEDITIREYGDVLKDGIRNISGALGADPIKERQVSEITINQLITDKIIEDLLKKRAISVSEEQVIDIIRETPPPEILRNPNFWVEGRFDYDKYLSLIEDPRADEFIRSYASQIMKRFPTAILRGEVSSMARITSSDAVEKLLEDSVKIRIEYIKLSLSEWKSDKTAISPEEFYSEHREMFRRDGLVKLSYVSFPISVSEEMIQMTRELANSILERAKTDSFELLMNHYSYLPDNRSLLNGWVKTKVLENDFATVVAKMSKGKVEGPIKSDIGFHILKLVDRQKDSVDMREIFLPVFPSFDEFQNAQSQAWKLVKKLRGEPGMSIPEEYNARYITLNKGEFPDIPVNYGTFLVDMKEGDVSYPLIGDGAFYVFRVEKKEEGIPPFSEIAEEVKDTLVKFEAGKRARVYALKNFSGRELPHKPEKGEWGITPYFTLNNYSGFAVPEKVALLAFHLKKDDILPPVRAGESMYIVKVVDLKIPNSEKIKTLIQPVAIQLQQSKEAFYFQKWFSEQRRNYDVEDFREKVYE